MDMKKEAEDMLANAKKQRQEMSTKAEAKGAAATPSVETKKTEEKTVENIDSKKVEDAHEQSKKDEELLSKDEKTLTDEEKARKGELLKGKEKSGADDDKSNVQKRIDKLTAKIKDLETTTATTKAEKDVEKAEKEALQSELEAIKKKLNMSEEDRLEEEVEEEVSALKKKYIEEDKKLPKEKRREMSKEEIDEWLLEDYEQASDWIARRSIRRYQDENTVKNNKLGDRKAKEIFRKQTESAERTYSKHPELDVVNRTKELLASGKSKQEALQIILSENPKYKLCYEILQENKQKYITVENGPELIVAEMEKRLGSSESKTKDNSEIEDLKNRLKALEEENRRLNGLDTEVSSTHTPDPKPVETEIVKETEKLGSSVGLSKEQIKKALERRKNVR